MHIVKSGTSLVLVEVELRHLAVVLQHQQHSSIPLIPVNNISIEESYQRFCGAMQKAAHHSIPRGFRPTYTPCLDEECQDLLKQYEESGDPDIADHLIESLDAARQHRWEELTSKMNTRI